MGKSSLSYTSRTLRFLKDQGVYVEKTERFNPYGGAPNPSKPGTTYGVRQDLFSFIDMIALYPGSRGIVAIQSTGPSGHSSHRNKIINECTELAEAWLKSGGKIELWSWNKRKLNGGKAERWVPRVEEITLDMIFPAGEIDLFTNQDTD